MSTENFTQDDLWAGQIDNNGGVFVEPIDYEDFEPTPADIEQDEMVAETRKQIGGESPDSKAPDWIQGQFPSLDWEAAFQTDFSNVDWLPGRFMERGQQITIVGDGKVGKSLFALDWAFRMAAGRSFIGDRQTERLKVLYFDRENSLRDITTRLQALGATPSDLENLVYKQFPQFSGTLDGNEKAGRELVKLAVYYGADVVVLDTVSRFIGGKENDSDTWLQLYQLVHAKLKHQGIACVRLDHFGKDAERGSRGSSAKTQDVDAVWELSRQSENRENRDGVEIITTTLKLSRTHTRSGLGDDLFSIVRKGERRSGGMWLTGRTRHELGDNSEVAKARKTTDVLVDEWIAAGLPKITGREGLKQWLAQKGRDIPRSEVLADCVRQIKHRQNDL